MLGLYYFSDVELIVVVLGVGIMGKIVVVLVRELFGEMGFFWEVVNSI